MVKLNCPVSQINVFESGAVGSNPVLKVDRDNQMLLDLG